MSVACQGAFGIRPEKAGTIGLALVRELKLLFSGFLMCFQGKSATS